MRHLTLTENAPAQPVVLTGAEAEALATTGLAVVTRTPGVAAWQVAAGSKVGVARVADLQVTVRPKIPVDRLVFLLGYARRPTFWRDQTVLLDVEADLPDALAHAFARLASKALGQGLLQGYTTVDEALPVLRGRLRVGDQISRRCGVGLPLEVTYDEYTVDVAENQLLLAATHRLLRIPAVSASVRRSLQRLRLALAGVSMPTPGLPLPEWRPSRLNIRYQPALHLADLVLAGDSFEQRIGDLRVSGFVVDMWKVYEDFVCVALSEAIKPFGGRSIQQHPMHLDDDKQVAMRPDFLWRSPCGPPVVVDAKYKAEKPSGFPQADLYQILAYCTVLGLCEGHLVYAKGNEDERVHTVQRAGVRIHVHTLDLAQRPEALLHQVADLAQTLRQPSATLS